TSGNAFKPGGGMWLNSSDIRVKKDVADFDLGLDRLEKVHVVKFKYNGLGGITDTGREYVGVVAQELEKGVAFLVLDKPGKLRPTDEKDTNLKVVAPSAFTFLLVNSVRELSAQNRKLAAENARLAARFDQQDAKLAELAAQNKAILAQNAQLAAL